MERYSFCIYHLSQNLLLHSAPAADHSQIHNEPQLSRQDGAMDKSLSQNVFFFFATGNGRQDLGLNIFFQ